MLQVAGYCRLSRDDENIGESGSISTQKEIIRQFCESQQMVVKDYYIDDGWTGTNFERPDFKRMIADVESGKIDCIITKDLSRLGRDYIMVGFYTEVYFLEKQVRYIAINDGYDTANTVGTGNDIAPFKNLLNDLYAKDISKKVRSAKRTKAINGEHGRTYAPIGYKKDPHNKNKMLVDEETAWIVRKIFAVYLSGMGMLQIRNYLEENRIIRPSALLHARGERYYAELDDTQKYRWSVDMVGRILHNAVYLGHSVHYRNIKPTHKSKTKRNCKENIMVVENTHEPLICKADFDEVQRRMQQHFDKGKKRENLLVGLVKCADCGKSMNLNYREYHGKRGTTSRRYLICYTYTKYGKNTCTCHHTQYDPLCKALVHCINAVVRGVQVDSESMKSRLHERLKQQQGASHTDHSKRVSTIDKRLAELVQLLGKLYEDRLAGTLSDSNFHTLTAKFQAEQNGLTTEKTSLLASQQQTAQVAQDIDHFIALCKQQLPIQTLTRAVAETFLDKVLIHETQTVGKEKALVMDVYFKFVGNIA